MRPSLRRRIVRILGSLALIAVLAGCEYVEHNGIGTRTWDAEAPPQDDITSFDGCFRNTGNQWEVRGSITNQTSERATYRVLVAFDAGDVRLDERTFFVQNLAPDQVAAMNRGWWIQNADRVTACSILEIDRFAIDAAEPAA